MQYRDLIYRIHARQSMLTRSISDECVERVLRDGEVIEDYPHAFPFPAKLLLGWCNNRRPIHVVAAEDSSRHLVIVVTAYEPTLDKWEPDMKTRRKRS